MATSRTKPRKSQSITQFPAPVTGDDIPAEFQDSAEPAEPTEPEAEVIEAPAAPPRPKKSSPHKKPYGSMSAEGDFFKRVAAIPRADWGTRVYLYLYVLEPLCNLRQSGGKTYLNRYSAPVADEHQIMAEHGSGRYRLMLSHYRTSPDDSSEVARHEFECYNPQYPPKIPKAAWINDSRNAKWEALLPKETPAAAAGSGASLVDAIKTYREIREDLKDELQEETPEPMPAQTPNDLLTTMKLAKDLFAQPAPTTPAPPKDPLEIALSLFTLMNQAKSENPVVDMYRDELKSAREEMKMLYAKLAEREKAEAPKSMLDQLTELAAMGEKIEPLKKIFGLGQSVAAEATGRASRTTAWDFLERFADTQAGAAAVSGLTQLAAVFMAPRPAQYPGMPPQPAVQVPPILNAQQNNGTIPQENPQQRMIRIGQTITTPMLYEFFLRSETGDTWAERMYDLWPDDYIFMKRLGAEQIVNAYRSYPPAWAVIAPKEGAFVQFMQEFCAWDADADEQTDQPEPPSGIKDYDQEETN